MEDSLSTMPKTLSKPKMPHPTKPDPRRRKNALIALAAALTPTSSSIRDPWRQHLFRSAISFSVPTARLQQRSMQGMANMLLLRRKGTSAQSQCFTQLVRELFHHGKRCEPSSCNRENMDAPMLEQIPAQRIAFDPLGVRMERIAVVFNRDVGRAPQQIAFQKRTARLLASSSILDAALRPLLKYSGICFFRDLLKRSGIDACAPPGKRAPISRIPCIDLDTAVFTSPTSSNAVHGPPSNLDDAVHLRC